MSLESLLLTGAAGPPLLARWKFLGTALDVASTNGLLQAHTPDIVTLGRTAQYWSQPNQVYGPSVGFTTFYMTLDTMYSHTVAPMSLPQMAQSLSLSLIPTITPGSYITCNKTFVLNITYVCVNSEDGGSVNVTVVNEPFAPSTFLFFKQCST